jgi:hypothetical protein
VVTQFGFIGGELLGIDTGPMDFVNRERDRGPNASALRSYPRSKRQPGTHRVFDLGEGCGIHYTQPAFEFHIRD